MRKRKRDIPIRILKRVMGNSAATQEKPAEKPKPPEPRPEPPAWLKQDDQDGHDHSHDHGHSHDHDNGENDVKQAPSKTTKKKVITVDAIETPNPNAIKFSTNITLTESSFSASSVEESKKHPLAEAIFVHQGVKNVFGVNDFVTVLKSDDADWTTLEQPIIDSILKVLE